MADKKKPQLGSASIIPPSRIVDIDTETEESPPGGSPPNVIEGVEYKVAEPPQPPARTTTASPAYPQKPNRPSLGEGKEYRVTLPDGRWVNVNSEAEAKQIAIENYGVSYPTEVIFEVIQPKPEPRPSLNRLAQTTTRTINPSRLNQPTYLPEDQKRLNVYARATEILKDDEDAQLALRLETEKAEQNKNHLHGPISERNLPAVAKMYGELKKYIYEGYADYYAGLRRKSGHLATSRREESIFLAQHSQEAQLYAMRYGMSSLTDLHRGLDLATWNFFFNSLGPLGEVLENIHSGEIAWNMKYYGGRAWWSPYRIDYLIKTLPEEKTVDFILDASKETLYLVGKATNFPIFQKAYDRYGRPVTKPVFTPLLKFQKGIDTIAGHLEAFGTESPILDLNRQLGEVGEKITKAYETKAPKSLLYLLERQHKITLERIAAYDKYYKKQWFGPITSLLFPKKPGDRRIALDSLRAKFFRTIFPKRFLHRARRPQGDVLSWLTMLLAQYIFEVTVGNLINIVAEKITSSAAWMRLTRILSNSKTVNTLRMSFNTTKEFLRAGPSLNTVSGTYLGYDLGGTIGRSLANAMGIDPIVGETIGRLVGTPAGLVTGWTYQWVLNLSKNSAITNWVSNYSRLSAEIKLKYGIYNRLVGKVGADSDIARHYLKEIQQLTVDQAKLGGTLTKPGLFTRFANWLNSPLGKFFRIPLKGLATSSIIEQLRLAGLELPSWYQPWMPPVGQYLWEIKGPLLESVGNVFRGGFSFAWKRIAFSGPVSTVMVTESNLAGLRGSLGAGRAFVNIKVVGPMGNEIVYKVEIATYNKLFTSLNNFYLTRLQGSVNILRRFGNFYSKLTTAITRNLFNPGFFIGLEIANLLSLPWWAYIPAAFVGSGVFAGATWLARGLFNFIVGRSPATIAALRGITFSQLLSRVSLGGFVGWGVGTILEMVFGIPNAALIGTIVGSVVGFGLTYLSLLGIGWATSIIGIGSTLGAAITGFFGSIGISLSLAGLAVVGAVTAVALLTVFAVVIIGSAFWIPFQERLEGVTSSSMCFDINPPTFNGLPQSTFAPNERKEVCWETRNKTEYYQDALRKIKVLSPAKDFTFHGYRFSITTPDGKTVLFEGNTNVLNKQQDGYTFRFTKPSTPQPGDLISFDEYTFELTPPKDAGGGYSKILLKQFEEQAKNIAQGNVSDYEENAKKLVALTVIQGANNAAAKRYLLEEQIKLLEGIKKTPPGSQNELNKLIDQEKIRIKNNINSGYKNFMTGKVAQLSGDPNTLGTINNCAGQADTLCSAINSYSLPSHLIEAVDASFDPYRSFSPDQIDQEIKLLKNSIKQIDVSNQTIPSTISQIREIKNLLTSYGYNTPEFDTELEKFAQTESSGIELYYLPVDTIIKTCLDVTYTGDGATVASARETDSAVVPLLGQLVTTSSCQAELITPINQRGPSSIINPVPGSTVSQGYTHGRGGHDGVDLAAPVGTNILAAASGTVVATGFENNGFGRYLIIQGDDGFYYLYAHMGSSVDPNVPYYAPGITVGSRVDAGEAIAYVGNTGRVSGPHLHFGISTTPDLKSFYNQNESTTIDPCLYIAGGCK